MHPPPEHVSICHRRIPFHHPPISFGSEPIPFRAQLLDLHARLLKSTKLIRNILKLETLDPPVSFRQIPLPPSLPPPELPVFETSGDRAATSSSSSALNRRGFYAICLSLTMNKISDLLGVDETLPIVLVQYERDEYGVGTEEHLHWALVVFTKAREQQGPCFQVVDRHYRDGRVEWLLIDQNVTLGSTKKCLGGVHIGNIKKSKLGTLREVVAAHPPVVTGWIDSNVPDQATLLPSLRVASKATKDAYDLRKSLPAIVNMGSLPA
ncbi:hypothetical protein EW146_g6047 [Bondarzewia mesenterica]|uniref:Uncharacterized protein n=1 Tax=Bondarzewia mesenterica TaxID=1095465 RepID=A0A4V3XEN0_9AGAM|nr:hypothetical protein EW146_g6047 [Bondarzewia mesenterica]